MLKSYIHSQFVLKNAKLIPDADISRFIRYLEGNGYSPRTTHDYLGAIIHFAHWQYQKTGLPIKVTMIDKVNFVDSHLPNCQCSKAFPSRKNICAAALSHWIRQVAPINDPEVILNKEDKLILAFEHYLKEVAGLSSATCLYRCRYAKEFLMWLKINQLIHLKSLTSEQLSLFICHRSTDVSLATTAIIACSLDCFLRFLSAMHILMHRDHLIPSKPIT